MENVSGSNGRRKGQPPRVRLAPPETAVTQIQRDALAALESAMYERQPRRPDEMIEVPITIGYMREWLIRSGATRKSRHYARECLAELQRMGLLTDTGRVLKPERQPSRLQSRWWRLYRVEPFANIASHMHAYTDPDRLPKVVVSLCSFLKRKPPGTAPKKASDYAHGSVQAAFASLGPP